MSNRNRGLSIDASYQISVHLAKRIQRRRIKKKSANQKQNPLGRPCWLTDRDEMCNLYRRPSIDASYRGLVQLAKQI